MTDGTSSVGGPETPLTIRCTAGKRSFTLELERAESEPYANDGHRPGPNEEEPKTKTKPKKNKQKERKMHSAITAIHSRPPGAPVIRRARPGKKKSKSEFLFLFLIRPNVQNWLIMYKLIKRKETRKIISRYWTETFPSISSWNYEMNPAQ